MPNFRAIALATGLVGLGSMSALTLATLPASAGAPTPTVHLSPFAVGAVGQSKPDDITRLDGLIYVSFQNNAGADGSPAGSMSTIVAFNGRGKEVATWSVPGRADGLTADRFTRTIYASVNEDNNSSLFIITPGNPTPAHYTYSPNPSEIGAGETTSNGGTDSITIGSNGAVYVAHSNPDPGAGNTAAEYTISLSGTTATLTRVFGVQDPATVVGTGAVTTLNLTDPDSNRFIPKSAPVLPGTLIQDSQADSQLVFVHHPGTTMQSLSVLNLTNAAGDPTVTPQLDDIVEVTGPGTLYVVDQANGTISSMNTKGITPGTLFVSQPAPSAGDLANTPDLGVVDPATGVVTHLGTGLASPKGLLFVPQQDDRQGQDGDQD
jgi:hypothetical protein